jgi:uncharacterized phage protein gp47/JayE
MTNPNLLPTGFVAPTTDEEVQALNALFLANVNGSLDLDPDQPMGQVIGIFAEKFAELSELGATVYNALNPAAAEGQLLVNVAALSGTRPQVATYSQVVANLSLNAATTVTAGAIVSVAGQPQNTWVLLANVVNAGGSPAVVPGTFRSSQPGPFAANAGTLTVIQTPTIGWTAVTNPLDAKAGLSADTDATLRQRRDAELSAEGAGDIDAIRAAVLQVPGVVQAFVYENVTLITDSTGLPGKSFRVVVWDGVGLLASNNAIAQAIWGEKPSGILAFGTTASGTATDSTGVARTVLFDRAQQVRLWVSCTTTPSTLSGSGTAAVKSALVAYALANFNLGVTVIDLPFRAAALVVGVDTDVPVFQFDTHAVPTNTANLPISGLQIATLASTDILVNGV